MELNYSKIFNREIIYTVSEFCKLNNIEDIDGFIKKCFISGLNIEKYGLLGKTLNEGEKQLIKEVIVEKRVEIPIEVIKEVIVEKEVPIEITKEVEKVVEVIKEVSVEKIVEVIKEVPVEKVVTKIEYISNKTGEDEMTEKIFQLNKELELERKNFSTKTEEMENNFHYEMSKKEKELDELRQTLDNTRQTLVDDNKVKMLQQTIQNLNSEIRDLKKKNEELNKKLLEQPKQNADIPARFHGGSNLNDDLYK